MRRTTAQPKVERRMKVGQYLLIGGIGLFLAACSKDNPLDGPKPPDFGPLFSLTEPKNGPGACLQEDTENADFINNVGDLNCVSEDVDISFASIVEYCINDGPNCPGGFTPLPTGERISCIPGDHIFARTKAFIENNANERYDLGLWINPTPGGSAKNGPSGQCIHYNLVPGSDDGTGTGGTIPSLDNSPDQCGDVAAGVTVGIQLDIIDLTCPAGGATSVTLDACAAWSNSTSGANDRLCPVDPPGGRDGFAWGTTPGTTAKCRCEPLDLPIDVKGVLRITKVTDPTGSTQSFDFTTTGTGYTTPFSLQDGDTNSSAPLSAGTYTATETVPTGWELTARACVLTGTATAKTFSSITNGVSVALAAGEDVTCTFTNTEEGSIKIVKDAIPNDAQNFAFTTTGTGLSNFSLDDDADGTLPNETTFSELLPNGARTVTETAVTGWTLTDIECTGATSSTVLIGADSDFDAGDNSVSITLAAGEDIVCTFENTKQGSIKIIKDAIPNAAQDFAYTTSGGGLSNFSLDDDGDATLPNFKEFTGLLPNGPRTVTETIVAGWALTDIACTGATNSTVLIGADSDFDTGDNAVSITLVDGENIVCTFENTKVASIKIVKDAIPNDPQDFAYTTTGTDLSDFSLDDDGNATLSNEKIFNGLLPDGARTVTETAVTGWTLTDIECTGATSSIVTIGGDSDFDTGDNSVSITLAAGEDIVCTFENTKQGSIKIIKDAIPNDPQDFAYTTSGTGLSGFSLDDDGDATLPNFKEFTGLLPNGARTVTETVPAGWTITDIECTGATSSTVSIGGDSDFDTGDNAVSITLAAGENIVCTFDNTKQGSIKIIKDALPDDAQDFAYGTSGGGLSNFSLDDDADITLPNFKEFTGLLPNGARTVTETVPSGWFISDIECTGATGSTVLIGADSDFDPGDNSVSITLAAGENIVCTFENTKLGKITIVKNTIGGDATFGFTHTVGTASDPDVPSPFNITTTALTGSQVFNNVLPSTYSVTETTLPSFWEFTSLSCTTGGSGAGQVATIVLPPGGDITCTFTNTFNPPSVGGRMTGGGQQVTVNAVDGTNVTVSRGFTIHCDIILSNNLEINWKGNKWHIEKPLTTAECFDDPNVNEEPPAAGFDTFVGTATGRLNGVDGYLIIFTFVDFGEPGKLDEAGITIYAPDGVTKVLEVAVGTKLTRGNIQAHEDQPHN